MKVGFAILCALGGLGCRDHASQAPVAPRAAPAALVPAPASLDDAVVARVNGTPIYASCVVAQAAHGHGDAKTGLDQCIEFELLAQAAEAKGLATDPEVIERTRAALVSRLVEVGFEASHQTPADVKPELDLVLARDPRGNTDTIQIPELRASAYARVVVPKTATPDQEAAAQHLADEIYRRLAGEPGLLSADLKDTGLAVVTGSAFELMSFEVPPHPAAWFDTAYGAALFGIHDVGRVAPVARTGLGFDVILLNGIEPAHELTREERVAEVFPDLRRSLFKRWVAGITHALNVRIVVDPAHVEQVLEQSS